MAALTLLPAARAEMDQVESALLLTARAHGLSWSRISRAIGLGPVQAARQRFDGSRAALTTEEGRDMAYLSTPDDLALHGVRVLSFPAASRVAGRYGLDVDTVEELLLDFEARGWVHLSFAGSSGWSPTDDGRVENERRLAAELDRAGFRDTVVDAHATFLLLNRRFARACTDWQRRLGAS